MLVAPNKALSATLACVFQGYPNMSSIKWYKDKMPLDLVTTAAKYKVHVCVCVWVWVCLCLALLFILNSLHFVTCKRSSKNVVPQKTFPLAVYQTIYSPRPTHVNKIPFYAIDEKQISHPELYEMVTPSDVELQLYSIVLLYGWLPV